MTLVVRDEVVGTDEPEVVSECGSEGEDRAGRRARGEPGRSGRGGVAR
jgi:hypothetical protein